jgi:hypothetical protein
MHNSTARRPKITALSTVGSASLQHGPTYTSGVYESGVYETVTCEECAGKGIDPGSLHTPEPCTVCCGSGYLLSPAEVERIARKFMGKATAHESVTAGEFVERKWRFGE